MPIRYCRQAKPQCLHRIDRGLQPHAVFIGFITQKVNHPLLQKVWSIDLTKNPKVATDFILNGLKVLSRVINAITIAIDEPSFGFEHS